MSIGGRPKGSRNQKSLDAEALAREMGVDPLAIMLHFANGDWKALGYKSGRVRTGSDARGVPIYRPLISLALRMEAARSATPYVRPARKAVDASGDSDEKLKVNVVYETEWGSGAEPSDADEDA